VLLHCGEPISQLSYRPSAPPFRITSAWQLALGSHPDKEFIFSILEGINCGFRVGFNYTQDSCAPPSAICHLPKTMGSYLAGKVPTDRIFGPLSSCTTSCHSQKAEPLTTVPYTWVNKRIRLFPKLQGNMRLILNMRLTMKAKIDHTPKTVTPFW